MHADNGTGSQPFYNTTRKHNKSDSMNMPVMEFLKYDPPTLTIIPLRSKTLAI